MKGKTEPEVVYGLLAPLTEAIREAHARLTILNARMLEAYRKADWGTCLETILLCREIGRTFGLDASMRSMRCG